MRLRGFETRSKAVFQAMACVFHKVYSRWIELACWGLHIWQRGQNIDKGVENIV